ncbi:MAG: ABC transporter permease, partial [Myxococcaceae bacterium]|nr:ABC transporter permease [Myxococcaceae bacterium]
PAWAIWVGAPAWLVGWGLIGASVRRTKDPEVVEPRGRRMSRADAFALIVIGAAVPLLPGGLAAVLVLPDARYGGRPINWAVAFGLWGLWAALAILLALIEAAARKKDPPPPPPPTDNPLHSPLHPALARYVDFYWGTLAAYGLGILAAEVAVILAHSLLAGRLGVAPPIAIALAGVLGVAIAFVSGFVGAANGRRLGSPEATIGLLYLGVPIPALLTAMSRVPDLQLKLGYLLRELQYVAGLIGRPELSYWLGFSVLVLALVFGITTGFVLTGSGRMDLRAGYELFVARRHVSIFRWQLLLGAFLVLLTGVIPALVIMGIVRAAEFAVERTRIKQLGLHHPLQASEAQNAARLGEQTPTAMMTALSVGGVGVGVMALIIVLSVMSGFEDDLQRKILGANSHGVVLKYGTDTFTDWPQVLEKVKQTPGIVGATPFILNEVMLSSEDQIAGTVIKGVDPKTAGTVTDLNRNVTPADGVENLLHPERIVRDNRLNESGAGVIDERPAGEGSGAKKEGRPSATPTEEDWDRLILGTPELDRTPRKEEKKGPVLPGIILGKELAQQLHVVVGDRINVVSPLGGELGPQGPMPKSRPFRVAGIFYSGMYEYDSKFAYISLSAAQDFFGLQGVSGIEVKVDDIDDARRIMNTILTELGNYPYRVRDWGEMNHNLFSALRLEKLVMGIILSIIVVVAAGLIVATVIMLVLEKRKEIAVLKALGVPDGGVLKIFLAEGLQIGMAGGLLGLLAGLAWCLLIEKVGIKLDPEVYYIPSLPVKVEPLQTAVPVVIAVLVTYLASIYPALKASRVEPVEGLKAE